MPLRFRVLAAGSAGAPREERAFELGEDPDEARIGRRPGLEIELPFSSVSTLHARIVRTGGAADWVIEDLGSLNGTWLDGHKLEPGQPRPLRAGQRIRVATVDVVFDGWSPTPRGLESTASLARRLVADLFGAAADEAPTLHVESGLPDVPAPSLRLPERDRRYVLGRAESADLALPSEHVSREHLVVFRRWNGLEAFDAGARNRTLLNGAELTGVARLGDGDRLELGGIVVRVSDPEDRYLQGLRHAAEGESGAWPVPAHTPPIESGRRRTSPVPPLSARATRRSSGRHAAVSGPAMNRRAPGRTRATGALVAAVVGLLALGALIALLAGAW